MATYFISDLHLSDHTPHLNKLFACFIEHILKPYDSLYILGDWFEYWVGVDQHSFVQNLVKRLMLSANKRHISWSFLAGNRDFLLRQSILKSFGGHALSETHVMELDTRRVLLLHGDTLCTEDVAYQAWRRKSQQKWLQQLFLSLPLHWRKKIANRLREQSQMQGQHLTEAMMDVNEQAVLASFQKFHISTMIHGHVHRPGIHSYWDKAKQQWLTRYVLADWDRMGNYLRFDDGKFDLCYFDCDEL